MSGPEDLAAHAGAAGVREQAALLIVQLLLGGAAAGVHRGARAKGRGLVAEEAPLAAGGADLAVGRAKALHDGGLVGCAQRPQRSNQRVFAGRDAAQEGRVAEGPGAGDALGRNLCTQKRMEGSEGSVTLRAGAGRDYEARRALAPVRMLRRCCSWPWCAWAEAQILACPLFNFFFFYSNFFLFFFIQIFF